ncbi:MAG: transglycosylase SLT domain-containing protein [Pseudomonadales bacterium]|nr:transglycosylase SLT domain-containing protein [Pseudomonadales bacterium]
MKRRSLLKAASFYSLATTSTVAITVHQQAFAQPLDFLLEKGSSAKMTKDDRFRLTKAVISVLETHYQGMTLQFWEQPFEKIDFEKRLSNIIYWIDLAIQQHKQLHPVDPVWVVSQIMAESLFCELAISRSLAAGICQFMPATATKSYQMLIAGADTRHGKPPYLKTEHADALSEYNQLIRERNQYRQQTRGNVTFDLKQALNWLAEGKFGMEEALKQIERNDKIAEFNKQINQAKDNYVDYIETNITELGKRDIFNHTDFFVNFDERFTYKKPIQAMVHMLANALRVRNGNILAAAAAYNAGLSRTWTNEALYTSYGTLPNYAETSQYLSRIVANYEEIANYYYG